MSIQLTSDAFEPGGTIPTKYTDDGRNVSPPLKWGGVPAGTRELVLIVDDPDAPRAEPFVHWVLYKIPGDAPAIPEAAPSRRKDADWVRGAKQGENSRHDIGYFGPSPPRGHGTHHYHFHLYALDKPLEVEGGLDNKALIAAMSGHVLDEGELIGTYER